MGYIYPELPTPAEGYILGDSYQTLSCGPYISGRVVTQAGRQYPLLKTAIRYWPLAEADAQPFLLLHRNVRGRAGTFTFFEPVVARWTRLYVGVGDGVSGIFDAPYKNVTSRTIYVDGNVQTPVTHFYTSPSGGTDGREQIMFTYAPAAGSLIEMTAVGQRAATCRFASDELRLIRHAAGLVELDIELEETR